MAYLDKTSRVTNTFRFRRVAPIFPVLGHYDNLIAQQPRHKNARLSSWTRYCLLSVLCLHFMALSITWVDLAETVISIRPFHVTALLSIIVSILFFSTRRFIILLFRSNFLLLYLFLLYFTFAIFGAFLNNDVPTMIVQFRGLFYFLLSIFLAAILCALNIDRPSNSLLSRFIVISGIIFFPTGIILTTDIGMAELLSSVSRALSEGKSNDIIFKIFGQITVGDEPDGESIHIGLRHGISSFFVVLAFFIFLHRLNLISTIYLFLCTVILLVLASRTAWLAFLFGITLIMVGNINKRIHSTRQVSIWPILFLTIVSIFISVKYLDNIITFIDNRWESASRSLQGRILATNDIFAKVVEAGIFPPKTQSIYGSAHNFIIDGGASGGLICMIIGFLIVLAITRQMLRYYIQGRMEVVALLGLLVARMFTAGGGIPSAQEFLALSLMFLASTERLRIAAEGRKNGLVA